MSAQTFSHARLFVTLWIVASQAPLSMEFSRQEYWSGLPFLSPGDLPSRGIELASPALAGGFYPTEPPMLVSLLGHRTDGISFGV